MTSSENTTRELSQRKAAAIGGYSYLLVFILGIFANFFAYEQIVVPGNDAATFHNLITHETLFRFGIAAWLIVIVCDTLVAWALYIILKEVDQHLALLA